MSLAMLEWDEWTEASDHGSKDQDPPWERVEDAILSLDGCSRTIVKLGLNEDAYMMVAGGSDGNYIVFATTGDGVFSHLTKHSNCHEPVLLDIGGQPGEYPSKRCITLDEAVQAAKDYFETGQLESNMRWETT